MFMGNRNRESKKRAGKTWEEDNPFWKGGTALHQGAVGGGADKSAGDKDKEIFSRWGGWEKGAMVIGIQSVRKGKKVVQKVKETYQREKSRRGMKEMALRKKGGGSKTRVPCGKMVGRLGCERWIGKTVMGSCVRQNELGVGAG